MAPSDKTHSDIPALDVGKKTCRVCGEQIQQEAKKCIHCDAYQDWTRHFLRWSTLVITLLSVAPLWGIANSLHKLAFVDKKAQLDVAITHCSTHSITIAYANSGELDGIVQDIDFSYINGQQSITPDYQIRALDYPAGVIVSPNDKPVLVDYKAYIGDVESMINVGSRNSSQCLYQVKVNWTDLRGNANSLERTCACP